MSPKKPGLHGLFAFFVASSLTLATPAVAAEKPKLVVMILVDQLRYDYLERFHDQFTEGGFKLLMDKGVCMTAANYDYMPTVTGPGHASAYSGSPPAMHGIIGNDWFDKRTRKNMYCCGDPSVLGVGTTDGNKMSPRNFTGSNFADQLRLAYRAKVVGISMKDRGAILPAGKKPLGAYWFEASSGNFVTSTYYMAALPGWVQAFNERKRPTEFLDQKWDRLLPTEAYEREDNLPGEGWLAGDKGPFFPHIVERPKRPKPPGGMAPLTAETPTPKPVVTDDMPEDAPVAEKNSPKKPVAAAPADEKPSLAQNVAAKPSEKELAEKEAAEKNAALKKALDGMAAEKEAAAKAAAAKAAAEKEAAEKAAAEKNPVDKATTEKQAAEKKAAAEKAAAAKAVADKEAAEKAIADKKAADKKAADDRAAEEKKYREWKESYGNILATPYSNQLLAEFARATIEGEHLGEGAGPDLLTLSFSAVDAAGHTFGPYSQEVQDITLRLDRELAALFAWLDKRVGLDNVVITLTADHAVMPTPEFAKKEGLDARRVDDGALMNDLQPKLSERFQNAHILLEKRFIDGQLYFNHDAIRAAKVTPNDVFMFIRDWALDTGKFQVCYSRDQILGGLATGLLGSKVTNGFNPERSGDMVLVYKPFTITGSGKTGTTHGSPYAYDTHVPILFYGKPFRPGRYADEFYITDLVPTLCAALRMNPPAMATGKPLPKVLADNRQ